MAVSNASILACMRRGSSFFWKTLRVVVNVLAIASGLCILAMVGITCVDILFRTAGHPFVGAYDLVRIAGALAIAFALPYTTAVKGHVAIEYFFLKMNKAGRILVDSVSRLVMMTLFGTFAWQCMIYGGSLKRSGEVSLTLGVPLYWIAYVISLSFLVTLLVTLHNLLHPGREMIKP